MAVAGRNRVWLRLGITGWMKKKEREEEEGSQRVPGVEALPRQAGWHDSCLGAAPVHVARQSLPAAPRALARAKGSPHTNIVCVGLFLKYYFKKG